jgi:naringenin degradation protein FdeH
VLQKIRRVVTGHKDGKATIMIDDLAPNATEVKGWKGLGITELWVTNETPIDNSGFGADQGGRPMRHDPTPSGTIFRVVEFPPEASGTIDAKAVFEAMGSSNKPRAKDSAKHPSMHKTNTVDYLVVIAGEMWMVMEEGEVLLRAGDCVVQRGTNHAWINKSDRPCLLAAILIDAKPAG